MGTTLGVATVDVLDVLSRWHGRRALLVGDLASLSPGPIALQEVTDPPGASTAHRLSEARPDRPETIP